jgi:hypothetical protein
MQEMTEVEKALYQHQDLHYLSRLFQKTSSKPTELYVLTRLWHQLNDLEIQMIPQQYVNLPGSHYAMTDVFFPQANIFVEINEPAHYNDAIRIKLDEQRRQNILQRTGVQVSIVDCREPLLKIHQQIDRIVNDIKKVVDEHRHNGNFYTWRPNEFRNPNYWKKKGVISLKDDIILNNIEDICTLFGADFNKTKRGFLRKGAIAHPHQNDFHIWWPSAYSRSGWHNESMENDDFITESHDSSEKTSTHYNSTAKWPHKRLVFYFQKDVLGFTGYYFKGVYEIDLTKSNEQDGIIWCRVGTEFQL